MKCVYCGKEYTEGGTTINISNGVFDVCSNECKALTREYLNKDMKYKKRTYLLVFFSSLGFIISMIFMSGTYKLVPMYVGMIMLGITLSIYPYIFQSFVTFTKHSVVSLTRLIRIVGIVIALVSIIFIVLTFTA